MVRSAGGPVRGREWAAATDRVPAVENGTPAIYKTTKLIQKISVADPNPGTGIQCFNKRLQDGKKSGSGNEKKQGPGLKKSGSRIKKNPNTGWKKSGSGTNIPDHIRVNPCCRSGSVFLTPGSVIRAGKIRIRDEHRDGKNPYPG
jgi:hypothetical protein